ncbi:MAG TPA: imidazolonepropionase [Anaerolineaceae bacterium]|nr:imidazolonepropionase [Anaerolineaceae bacterium]HQP09352.1 imidazolonepropionase [Anaerolineaceae bacterium]
MLIHSASQLVTPLGGARRGKDMSDLQIIPDGAVLVRDGIIRKVGSTADLLKAYPDEEKLDANGKAIIPGLVDPHTHLVWAGNRAAEFEMRLQGKTYMEIMAAGGGIASTVRDTRNAGVDELVRQALPRARSMFAHGTTTAEAKSGYGLELGSEIDQLQAILKLDAIGPLELAPTFLGAHAVAPEYLDDPDGYTTLVADEMLPSLKEWWKAHAPKRPLPHVDVFCEVGAFNLQQTRQILEKAKSLGFPLKVHVDEFEALGGTRLAVELGAATADHLVKTTDEELHLLAESNTVAVSLPCTPFGLADPHYTRARTIIDHGGVLALASDLNPGTAWCGNMQFVMALACRYLKLTPAEALTAATINAAAAINRQEIIGSIEPGKQADLLILNVDDYRHLMYRFGTNLVETVIKAGRVYPI